VASTTFCRRGDLDQAAHQSLTVLTVFRHPTFIGR
jgi:hypothetical protein